MRLLQKKRVFMVLLGGIVILSSALFFVLPSMGQRSITVLTINNPDMVIMERLSKYFMEDNPGIKVGFLVLPDFVMRQLMTTDAATGTGRYNVVTLGPYEVQSGWAKYKWLTPLNSLFENLPSAERDKYNLDGVISSIRDSITVDGELYALPFYGESNNTYYRKDLFEASGLEMPLKPKWTDIESFAKKLHAPDQGVYGTIMKGFPGYGQMAPLMTLLHSWGARWFDMNWHPLLTSPEFKRAFTFYINLLKNYGEPGATSVSYNEGLTLMAQGKGAIWVDATVAAGHLENVEKSKVAGKLGYAFAPYQVTENGSRWLWTWAVAINAASKDQNLTFKFIRWATSKEYIELVAREYGWKMVPPGTRYFLYDNSDYQSVAPFYEITLRSIETADNNHPAAQPVPYTGTCLLNIPEWAAFAADFGQHFSGVVAGKETIDEALEASQKRTEEVMRLGGYIK